MKIDVHAHHIPESCINTEAVEAGQRWGIQIRQQETGEVLYSDSREAMGFDPEQIYSIDRRLRDMSAQRLDMHVLSVPPFAFFYGMDPARGLALCRRINDAFAETVDVPVFIHPSNVLGADRLRGYHLGNLIGNPTDSAVAAASLIFGGVLKEFPRLKFYLAHGGGSCPYIRGRWEHGWRVRPEARVHIEKPPSEYFRLLCFDSLTHSVPALNYLVESVGPERVMLGTDYPFDMGDYDSVKTIASLPHLSDSQKELIYGGNAATLFKLSIR